MTDMITIQGKVTEDGQLIVQLPPDAPRGDVEITVKKVITHTPEEEAAADAEFEALLRDQPGFVPARLGLVDSLRRRGRCGDASEILEEGLRLRPSDGQLSRALAQVRSDCRS